jgi:hypothetical protein
MRASISVAIAGLVWFSTYASAQPNKELYELQERCGKRAEEFFRREYGPRDRRQKAISESGHFKFDPHPDLCRVDRIWPPINLAPFAVMFPWERYRSNTSYRWREGRCSIAASIA